MKKKIVIAILVAVLILPRMIDGVNAFTLRFITPPEEVLQRFYTQQDLAEDQLEDVLILAGEKMIPLMEKEINKKDIKRRVYMIDALGLIGTEKSISILEQILIDQNEQVWYRAAALVAIARIDVDYGKKIALQYGAENNEVMRRAQKILGKAKDRNGDTQQQYNGRTYWDAFRHHHD